MPLFIGPRFDEELEFHLFKLAGPENEVARRDLVAERLTDLGDPKRGLHARTVHHVLEVHENTLGCFGTQEVQSLLVIYGAEERFE